MRPRRSAAEYLSPKTRTVKIVFLGTGTSVGVPMIGCHCAVCRSTDPRNQRLRASLLVVVDGFHVVVDTSPDFRAQALTHQLPRVDAVLFTHAHADHILGLDDLRRFNTLQGEAIPAWGMEATLADVRRMFRYVNESPDLPGEYRPRLRFQPIEGVLTLGPLRVEALPVMHGATPTVGYRIEANGQAFGYAPDCRGMDSKTCERFSRLDVMILDGLRHRPHPTHLTIAESVRYLQDLRARRGFLTHLCHEVDHATTEATLPSSIRLAYDGLRLEW